MLKTLIVLLLTTSITQAQPPKTVEAIARSEYEITVHWESVTGATGYRIQREGKSFDATGDARQWSDREVQPGQNYRYTVSSIVGGKVGPPSRSYLERTDPVLADRTRCDVLVVGATTAGISAATVAARYGMHTVMVEETRRLGGMPVNGLGATDLRRLSHSSGLFEEFRRRVQAIYGGDDGLAYEPRVAHQAMKEIIWAEPNLTVHRGVRPIKVTKSGREVTTVVCETISSGRRVEFIPKIVIDATECGDVAAWAGAPFRVGREAKSAREPHAGHLYYDRAGDKPLPGSTGKGDKRVQAYAYLMTVKDFGPGADRTLPKPEGYDPDKYEHAVRWDQSWAVSSGKLPNNKFEINMHPHGSDLQGVNYRYPTANYAERRKIEKLYRDHALGYLYYIQTVEGKRHIGLSEDDYREGGGWPSLLYIREARRFEADVTLDETDIRDAREHFRHDAIGIGDYPMDSHAVQPKTDWTMADMGEGEFYLPQYTPWHQVPYRIMIPKGLDNVYTPTAVSATHVAYGTVRLEPVRMHFGAAAGIAAALCLRENRTPRDVPVAHIQDELLKRRPLESNRDSKLGIANPGPSSIPSLLYVFPDVSMDQRYYHAIQWLAARGLWPSSVPATRTGASVMQADPFRPDAPLTWAEVHRCLRFLAAWDGPGASSRKKNLATEKAGSSESVLRGEAARVMTEWMDWHPAKPFAYADLPEATAEARAAAALRERSIGPGLLDSLPDYDSSGKPLFHPERMVTRAQFAELLYLMAIHLSPNR